MNIFTKISPEEYAEERECNCIPVLNEGAAYLFAMQRLSPVFVRKALSAFDTDDAYESEERVESPTRFVMLNLLTLPLPGIRRFQPHIYAIDPEDDDDGTRWGSEMDRLISVMRMFNEGETGTVHTTNPLIRGVVAVVDDVVDYVLYTVPEAKPGEPWLMDLDEREWMERVAPMLAQGFFEGQRDVHVDSAEEERVLRLIAKNLYTIKEAAQDYANKYAGLWKDVVARRLQDPCARRLAVINPAVLEIKRQNETNETDDSSDRTVDSPKWPWSMMPYRNIRAVEIIEDAIQPSGFLPSGEQLRDQMQGPEGDGNDNDDSGVADLTKRKRKRDGQEDGREGHGRLSKGQRGDTEKTTEGVSRASV